MKFNPTNAVLFDVRTADASEMVVTWLTTNRTGEQPVCFYGEEKLKQQQAGTETEFIDGGGNKVRRYIHRVTLKDLVSGNTYSEFFSVLLVIHWTISD